MLIICPKCSAKYKLPDEISLKNDQKLKCSMCQILFTADESATLDLTQQMLVSESLPLKNTEKRLTETMSFTGITQTPVQNDVVETVFKNDLPSKEGDSQKDEEKVIGSEIGRLLSNNPAEIMGRTSTADILPEVFMPVTTNTTSTSKKNNLLIVLIYLLVIGGVCFAGWFYREALMPSFYTFMPTKVERVKSEPKVVKANVKLIEKAVKPVNKSKINIEKPKINTQNEIREVKVVVPEVSVPATPKKIRVIEQTNETSLKAEGNLNNSKTVVSQAENNPVSDVVVSKVVTDSKESESNVVEEKHQIVPNIGTETPVVPLNPENALPVTQDSSEQTPSFDEPVDDVPLLDIVAEPIPLALESELVIKDVHFNVTPNEQGVSQMLIEGTVMNTASDIRSIPVLIATVWDENSQILERKKIHVIQDRLNPTETISFFTSLVPAPVGAHHVDVTF